MSLGVGSFVCVHGSPDMNGDVFPWVGEVCSVIVDGETTYRVKQMGRMQRTAFSFTRDELHETVLTFEGPKCVTCGTTP